MGCGAAAETIRRAAVPEARPLAYLAVLGTAASVRRNIGGDGAVSKGGLACSTTVIRRAAAEAARRAAVSKRGSLARLVVGAAQAICRDVAVPVTGAGTESWQAVSTAVAVAAAAEATGGAGVTERGSKARLAGTVGTAAAVSAYVAVAHVGTVAKEWLAAGATVGRRGAAEVA